MLDVAEARRTGTDAVTCLVSDAPGREYLTTCRQSFVFGYGRSSILVGVG